MRLARLGVALLIGTALGCRGPELRLMPPVAQPAPPPPVAEPAVAPLAPIEPDYKTLPILDPATMLDANRAAPRGIQESEVARVAGSRALVATVLRAELGIPRAVPTSHDGQALFPQADHGSLLQTVRELAGTEARNRSASEALIAFYQLADAEGRGDLLRKAVGTLDKLKEAVADAKARGARVPVELDELDRQRGALLAVLGQADLGAKLLNVDLRRRLGLPGSANERLVPGGDFRLSDNLPEAEVAVAEALSQRADLQALRTLYLRLDTDTLPAIREYLQALPGLAGAIGAGPPPLPFARRRIERRISASAAVLDIVLTAEVGARRKQLWAVIEEKERGAADEVRAALFSVTEQVRQAGLARWRAEQLMAKAEEERKQGKGAILERLAEIEALRARADVIAAIMQWHQARVRLNTAMGRYNGTTE